MIYNDIPYCVTPDSLASAVVDIYEGNFSIERSSTVLVTSAHLPKLLACLLPVFELACIDCKPYEDTHNDYLVMIENDGSLWAESAYTPTGIPISHSTGILFIDEDCKARVLEGIDCSSQFMVSFETDTGGEWDSD